MLARAVALDQRNFAILDQYNASSNSHDGI
jgi:hypothetical protein